LLFVNITIESVGVTVEAQAKKVYHEVEILAGIGLYKLKVDSLSSALSPVLVVLINSVV